MDHVLKANMRVDEDSSAEDRIRDWVEGPGSEWSYCQRYQSGGYQSVIFSLAETRWL